MSLPTAQQIAEEKEKIKKSLEAEHGILTAIFNIRRANQSDAEFISANQFAFPNGKRDFDQKKQRYEYLQKFFGQSTATQPAQKTAEEKAKQSALNAEVEHKYEYNKKSESEQFAASNNSSQLAWHIQNPKFAKLRAGLIVFFAVVALIASAALGGPVGLLVCGAILTGLSGAALKWGKVQDPLLKKALKIVLGLGIASMCLGGIWTALAKLGLAAADKIGAFFQSLADIPAKIGNFLGTIGDLIVAKVSSTLIALGFITAAAGIAYTKYRSGQSNKENTKLKEENSTLRKEGEELRTKIAHDHGHERVATVARDNENAQLRKENADLRQQLQNLQQPCPATAPVIAQQRQLPEMAA